MNQYIFISKTLPNSQTFKSILTSMPNSLNQDISLESYIVFFINKFAVFLFK